MPLFSFEGTSPSVHETAFIAPTASIVGDVTIEAGASVWYGAVLRADFGPIVVKEGANVQDGSVLHAGPFPCVVGPGATIGHSCVVHGATIGAEALVGNGAIVLDGAVVGDGAMVAAGSVLTGQVPDDTLVMGVPAREKGPVTGSSVEAWVRGNPAAYQELARRHRDGIQEL
ncbi:gamma carbonic anhydrase family protein [Nocardioides mangrovicus]|uniref:Gamma carbonic anhydrase family protein n=1 Tax=Nocardioides mangrovicus TaxID=2478913 RepID=A0A3L8P216_9ACTN|nr:gamma carbonic anhydrase family protein [Nocardioides mangrovicus]RLV49335.1 gamma carbonic anhydrase family protein [Nocardioides mangrovicus]